ncbi:MAG: energy-coupling factor ABC transporter permease [Steroidobacteraceae bacterium]
MADPLLSPTVGGAFWLASGAAVTVAARRVRRTDDERLVPLMGVLGAFVFAAQMLNFAIPGTGSSGHLGGGLLLAILLGPSAALVVMASVLTVQSLFFADGGLLALGCNVFNMGVVPALLAAPLVYRPVAGTRGDPARIAAAALLAAILALQLGALGVVAQSRLSAVASLPTVGFLLLMQPIHLAIGIVEGLATAAIVVFTARMRPDLLATGHAMDPARTRPLRPVLLAIAATALLLAGGLSLLASSRPDGLEWTIERLGGSASLPTPPEAMHAALERIQSATAVLRDYSLGRAAAGHAAPAAQDPLAAAQGAGMPAAAGDAGGAATATDSSGAGLIGGVLTLALVLAAGARLRRQRRS